MDTSGKTIETIETERLILRAIVTDDAEFLFSIYGDPEFMRFIGKPADSLEQIGRMIERIQTKHYDVYGLGTLLVVNKETGEPLGDCGFLMQNVDDVLEHEVAYGFHKRAQGFGYATEAARAVKDWGIRRLNLKRMISIVHIDNLRSADVARRNDMEFEKTTYFQEMPVDIYVWHNRIDNP